MEGLIATIVLVVLAVPAAIIYLLVRVSSLKDTLAQLKKKIDLIESRVNAAPSNLQSASNQFRKDQVSSSADTSIDNNIDSNERHSTSSSAESSEPSISPLTKPSDFTSQSRSVNDDAATSDEQINDPDEPQSPSSAEKESSVEQFSLATKAQPTSKTKPQAVQPSPFDRWADQTVDWVKRYFTEGNLIVRVGILVLFIGVAFLLKYASDNSMLPIELRVAGVALAGIAILITGWRLRHKKNDYALVLQGGGIGILYLTAFAALKLFHLLPSGFVFACLLFMVVLSATLAILQNSRALAVLATSGGFLAPVLSSTGDGSHIALFSYYAVLNVGILAIAWFRSWRLLNVLGFGFTFVIGLAWGVKSYEPTMFASAESFLILFFLFYVVIALLFAQRQTPNLRGYVDGTLVFGVPLVAFSIQAALVKDMPFVLAFSALFLGFFYLSLATIYQKGLGRFVPDSKLKLLSESFLALGVIFASLTIPFALDGEWIASAWALEGAGILWISVKQNRKYGIFFGLALQVLGGFGFLQQTDGISAWPILNSVWIGASLVAAAGFFSSYYLKLHGARFFTFLPKLSIPFLIWGLVWWIGNGLFEIHTFVFKYYLLSAWLLFFSFTALGLLYLEHRLKWNELAFGSLGLGIAMLAIFLFPQPHLLFSTSHFYHTSGVLFHTLTHFGWIAWPVAFCSLWFGLFYRDKSILPVNSLVTKTLPILHLGALWLFTIIAIIEMIWLVNSIFKLSGAWLIAAFSLPAVIVANSVMRFKRWPIIEHKNIYKAYGVVVTLIYLVFWSVIANIVDSGSAKPLPYIPILNPLDVLQAMGIITMLYWWTHYGKNIHAKITSLHSYGALALLGFLAFNATLIRFLHHWFDVPYTIDGMMNSNLTQAVLSITWTLVGLITMIIASKKYWREVWIAAAVLLGLTVGKLLLLDLADREALITIVSFIVVGMLLLVVGYFSPIPPKEKAHTEDTSIESSDSNPA